MSLVGTGSLIAGQTEQYNVMLAANVTYTVYVRPERSSADFDLRIYDENGNLVQWDERPASDAVCYVTPRWRGLFRIIVSCAAGGSSYGVIVDP